MFTKLAADITFSDIEAFCREFGEGVRVEYKQEIKNISKIVSSFANTLGGIFIIGAKTDSTNQVIFPIQGIPKKSGIEEQIQQSALIGIYPAVIPEVIICDVPNTGNVVVIIRVDESLQAPHAIENSTRVYIRVGSITQPYELELAEVDRIEYMLKRREDSQIVTRQILERTEKRIESFFITDRPNLTVIVRPVLPYHPVMATAEINNFAGIEKAGGYQVTGAAGGLVAFMRRDNGSDYDYREFNEYGIVYHRLTLERQILNSVNTKAGAPLNFRFFILGIGRLIKRAQSFYIQCEYLGNIEIKVQLRQIFNEKLNFYDEYLSVFRRPAKGDFHIPQQCIDSEVIASIQCFPRDLATKEKFIDIVDQLAGQLLWAFNIDTSPTARRNLVKHILQIEIF